MSAQPSDLKLSQPQTSVSTPSTTCRAGIFRHKNKKSDNGWAKAGNLQLGFRGAIGSAMVVTARLLLRVPAASVFLDLSSAADSCMSWPAVDDERGIVAWMSLSDAHICRQCRTSPSLSYR